MRNSALSALAAALIFTVPASRAAATDGVVLVIGDGVSMDLLTAARIYQHGVKGELALEKMPHTAFVKTFSADNVVTDSSAAATALARGVKVANRHVGTVESPHPSILDIAKSAGWSTAVIGDDEVTGGTGSPFVVDHPNRNEPWLIASKIVTQLGARVDIAAGGGAAWFGELPEGEFPPEVRETAKNAAQMLADSRVRHITKWEDYVALAGGLDAGSETPILATLWPRVFPYIAEGERAPRLVELTEQTVKLLRARGKPFLLVIEAALPDKASHSNSARRAIAEVIELDATIAWLMQNLSPDTLLLATTDHSTGRLAINGYFPHQVRGDALLGMNPITENSILTWASGPGGTPASQSSDSPVAQHAPGSLDYKQPALIPLELAFHTGEDVWLLGSGPGSEKVRGFLDNTAIFQIMKEAIGERSGPGAEAEKNSATPQ